MHKTQLPGGITTIEYTGFPKYKSPQFTTEYVYYDQIDNDIVIKVTSQGMIGYYIIDKQGTDYLSQPNFWDSSRYIFLGSILICIVYWLV